MRAEQPPYCFRNRLAERWASIDNLVQVNRPTCSTLHLSQVRMHDTIYKPCSRRMSPYTFCPTPIRQTVMRLHVTVQEVALCWFRTRGAILTTSGLAIQAYTAVDQSLVHPVSGDGTRSWT